MLLASSRLCVFVLAGPIAATLVRQLADHRDDRACIA